RTEQASVGNIVAKHLLACRKVPDPYLPVRAAGGQVLAVGVESDTDDQFGVRFEGLYLRLARPAVPDLDGPVPARGGELFPVRAECHAVNFRLVRYDQRIKQAEPHQVMPFPLA